MVVLPTFTLEVPRQKYVLCVRENWNVPFS